MRKAKAMVHKMTEIVSDVVVSLFAVMGLIFVLNELSALFGKNALGGASVYVIRPGDCQIDSEYILNLTKTVPADKYIIVTDTAVMSPIESVKILQPSEICAAAGDFLSAVL